MLYESLCLKEVRVNKHGGSFISYTNENNQNDTLNCVVESRETYDEPQKTHQTSGAAARFLVKSRKKGTNNSSTLTPNHLALCIRGSILGQFNITKKKTMAPQLMIFLQFHHHKRGYPLSRERQQQIRPGFVEVKAACV